MNLTHWLSHSSLASRLAWIALSLSCMASACAVTVATLWISHLERQSRLQQVALDVRHFSAIISTALEQYDFASVEALGHVFARENHSVKDLEIWHYDGLRIMQYGAAMTAPDDEDVVEYEVRRSNQKEPLGKLRYRARRLGAFSLASGYLPAATLMIVCSCFLTALFMQRRLRRYLALPLSQLTQQMGGFDLKKSASQLRPAPGSAYEIKQLYDSFQHMARRMQQQATTDPVTGLKNRIYLEQIIEQAANDLGSPCAVLLMDLDHFKRINDNYGHPTGDCLLNAVAKRLSPLLDERAELIRMGGDEFAVWVHQSDHLGALHQLAVNLRQSMLAPFTLDNGRCVEVRLSGGLAHYPDDVSHPRELLKAADLALYQSKEQRKGDISSYHNRLSNASNEWMEIADQLRQRLKHAEPKLDFYFQAIAYSHEQSSWGHEMLLRLSDEHGKLYNTEKVVQVALQLGLSWALVEASVRHAVAALDKDLVPNRVCINLAPEQVSQLTPHHIQKLFEPIPCHLRPRLVIELTEQSLLNKRDVLTPIKRLQLMGFPIALDDFGSGYSAMACLSSFPLSIVKIDKSLTQGVLQQPKKRDLLSCLTYTSHTLGFQVVAEGIESAAQYTEITRLGCDLCQGYFIGRPIPLEQIQHTTLQAPPQLPDHNHFGVYS